MFLHTYSNDIAKHFKVPLDSLVLMHPDLLLSQYEEKFFTLSKVRRHFGECKDARRCSTPTKQAHKYFQPDATQDHMVRFVDEHLYPLVGHRTAENLWKYITKFPLVVVYYDVDFSFDNRDGKSAGSQREHCAPSCTHTVIFRGISHLKSKANRVPMKRLFKI